MGREVEVKYTEELEWRNRLTEGEQDRIVVRAGADESTRSRRRAMKHRGFSELTKDWSPERKARVAAMTAQLVDELETEKRERRRGQVPRKESSSQPAAAFTASSGKTHALTGPSSVAAGRSS